MAREKRVNDKREGGREEEGDRKTESGGEMATETRPI